MGEPKQDLNFVLYSYALTFVRALAGVAAVALAWALGKFDRLENACDRERIAIAPWVNGCRACGKRKGKHEFWCVALEDEPSPSHAAVLTGYVRAGFLKPGEVEPGDSAGCATCKKDKACQCPHSEGPHLRCFDCGAGR